MLNFKKVLTENNKEKSFLSSRKKKNQEIYERNVGTFLQCCEYFNTYIERRLSVYDSTMYGFTKNFKDTFGFFMKKRLSRTSKVLNEMYKRLKKFDKNAKVGEKIEEIKKDLKFTPKSSSGDYAKRSTIDNPKVAKYFNEIFGKSLDKFGECWEKRKF